MGRRAQGYTVRQPNGPGTNHTVRFRHPQDGRVELSTGTSVRAEAEREARRLYGEAILGVQSRPTSSFKLTAAGAAGWLASLALRPETVETYTKRTAKWIREVEDWSGPGLDRYFKKRLRETLAKTVQSEVSAMTGMLEWLVAAGELDTLPEPMPSVPKGALGKQSKRRVRCAAPELSPKEVSALLKLLPEKSEKDGFWVKPRCELMYETSLRPFTVDRLSTPEHWVRGAKTLNITADIDKEGVARQLPLSPRAIALLKQCAPRKGKSGVIFGEHRYWRYLRRAAKKALSADKARIFTGQHLRSARATHLLDAGAPLLGVQYGMGHKRTSTTARYMRPSYKAALAALEAMKKVG
jgi:integrase